MAWLTVLIMNLHIPKYHILYFIKISKCPTLKGQCGLEGIVNVINILPGINPPHASATDMHRYAIFTNITNNIIIIFNSRSVLENLLASDLLILFLYLWVPILLDKEAWHDIESYLLFCLMPGKK